MLDDPTDLAITRAIIGLGHTLDLKVVAEGVETEREAETLRGLELRRVAGLPDRAADAGPGARRLDRQGARPGRGVKPQRRRQAASTGIFAIRACHSFGPVSCTETPAESTATVTGMSRTSNS